MSTSPTARKLRPTRPREMSIRVIKRLLHAETENV